VPRRPSKRARLTHEQVEAYLRRAAQAFRESEFIAGSPKHVAQDFGDLQLFAWEDQAKAIRSALDEISPGDYTGPDPPNEISGEPKCKGARMLQFVWNSACFKKQMCFKFCMVGRRLHMLRIHEAYNPNRFGG
jgi:hypothetical protein